MEEFDSSILLGWDDISPLSEDSCDLNLSETTLDSSAETLKEEEEPLKNENNECPVPQPTSLAVIPKTITIGVNIQGSSLTETITEDVMTVYNLLRECMSIYSRGPALIAIVQVCVRTDYATALVRNLKFHLKTSEVRVIEMRSYSSGAYACVIRESRKDSKTQIMTWESFVPESVIGFHNLTGKNVHLHTWKGAIKTYVPDNFTPPLRLVQRDEPRSLSPFDDIPVSFPPRYDLKWVTDRNGAGIVMPRAILVTKDVAEFMQKAPFTVRVYYMDDGPGSGFGETDSDIYGKGFILKSSGLNHGWH